MAKINKKIIVAMSGGVDSSVAALLLKERYETVVGVFLHFWKDDEEKTVENKCCSTESMTDARAICQKLDIPFYTMNFVGEFKKDIVDYFLSEYQNGKTPNPCVVCNKSIKLGGLVKRARELGYDYVASGHYARVEEDNKIYKLFRGEDHDKDQSYFLSNLGQTELPFLLFPLAKLTKPEVRQIAKKHDLEVAEKKDSTEICFIPGKSHNDFLKKYLKLEPGDILDKQGNKLGTHKGLPLYTLGQRKGIEIGGTGPYYALRFDYKQNILYVTNDSEDPDLYQDEFLVSNINWVGNIEPKYPLVCNVVVRYRHNAIRAQVEKQGNNFLIKLEYPQRAITPGQMSVLYQEDEVLGCGTILV